MVKTPLRKRTRAKTILRVVEMTENVTLDLAVYEVYPTVLVDPLSRPSASWYGVTPFLRAAGISTSEVREFMYRFYPCETPDVEPWNRAACQLLILKAKGINP